jgi:hypothetical protein
MQGYYLMKNRGFQLRLLFSIVMACAGSVFNSDIFWISGPATGVESIEGMRFACGKVKKSTMRSEYCDRIGR